MNWKGNTQCAFIQGTYWFWKGKKIIFLPFLRKLAQLQWKICILLAECFPFPLFPDKTGFFLPYSYRIGLPALGASNSLKGGFLVSEETMKAVRRTGSLDFLLLDLLAFSQPGFFFPRSLQFVHITVVAFLGKRLCVWTNKLSSEITLGKHSLHSGLAPQATGADKVSMDLLGTAAASEW